MKTTNSLLDGARARAKLLWGDNANAVQRKPWRYPGNGNEPGSQAETHIVGVYGALPGLTVYGCGFTFAEAFEDAMQQGHQATILDPPG